MFTRVWFLYSIHYANSKICGYKISHEEIVSPLDRDGNSSALSFLYKLVRAARVLLTVFGLGQHFQDLGHSFSLYGPPSRPITYMYANQSRFEETRRARWSRLIFQSALKAMLHG